jgi:hypothetical protein
MHYVTNFRDRLGDIHQNIDIGKFTTRHFPIQKELDKSDVMIVCGDAGLIWDGSNEDKYWQKWLNEKSFTTFCCLGNHENYNLINEYPIIEIFSGKARQIQPSVFYAISGEIYVINNKSFLFINGADSQDKEWRTEGKSWWPQEQITSTDISHAFYNLEKYDFNVDYIISHTGGSEICKMLGFSPTVSDKWLDKVLDVAQYEKHYLGHYHLNNWVGKSRIIYNDIIELY